MQFAKISPLHQDCVDQIRETDKAIQRDRRERYPESHKGLWHAKYKYALTYENVVHNEVQIYNCET
jgi:hypothetical protein